jgi:hypothetical protein
MAKRSHVFFDETAYDDFRANCPIHFASQIGFTYATEKQIEMNLLILTTPSDIEMERILSR